MTMQRLQLLAVLGQCKFGEIYLDVPLVVEDPYGNTDDVTVEALTLGGALTKEYDESIPYDYFPEDIIAVFIEQAIISMEKEDDM